MPKWEPSPLWKGEDIYVIGGGSSLRGFDWSCLIEKYAIGCNDSFRLGADICDIAAFGDTTFFNRCQEELERFEGMVITNNEGIVRTGPPDWLYWMPRVRVGLSREGLGWNGNTGAMAVNLALILGAQRVLLLGFDMGPGEDGKTSWYGRDVEVRERVFEKHLKCFGKVASELPVVFPGREIVNVTDGSGLDLFPEEGVEEHFAAFVGGG